MMPETAIIIETRIREMPIYQAMMRVFIVVGLNSRKNIPAHIIYQYKKIYLCIDKINHTRLQ